MDLNLRPASECKFDAVSLGEVYVTSGSGRRQNSHRKTVPCMGRRRRIQRSPWSYADALE